MKCVLCPHQFISIVSEVLIQLRHKQETDRWTMVWAFWSSKRITIVTLNYQWGGEDCSRRNDPFTIWINFWVRKDFPDLITRWQHCLPNALEMKDSYPQNVKMLLLYFYYGKGNVSFVQLVLNVQFWLIRKCMHQLPSNNETSIACVNLLKYKQITRIIKTW